MSRVVTGVGVFLMADAALALALGRRYVLWGLGRAPRGYGRMIERVADLPEPAFAGVRLGEGVLGVALFAAGRWLGR